jgi:hypothetical protein
VFDSDTDGSKRYRRLKTDFEQPRVPAFPIFRENELPVDGVLAEIAVLAATLVTRLFDEDESFGGRESLGDSADDSPVERAGIRVLTPEYAHPVV